MEELEQKNKYYTPDISEFRVGFEYEEFSPKFEGDTRYIKTICQVYDLSDIMKYWSENTGNEYYRVKYLDRQDIEELGFSFVQHLGDDIYYDDFLRFEKEGYYLEYSKQWNKLLIHNGESYEQYDCYFQGIVKNKSELEIILQQIGVSNSSVK